MDNVLQVDNDFYLNIMELALDYRIYKSYRVEGKIGKGVYGEVFKVLQKGTQRPYAIKKIVDAFQNITDAKRTYRQLAYMLQLSHPCIIKLEKVIISEQDEQSKSQSAKNVYAVLQLMEIDLAKTLQICKLESLQRKYIAMQILFGLQYLHQSQLIHRDIKPSNIVVNHSCTAKICDFGLVRLATQFTRQNQTEDQIFTEYVASKWYRAPELMLSGNQASTYAIDIWSAGCLFAQMILGVPLFTGNNTIQQLQRIFMVIGMPLQSEIQSISSQNGKFLLKNFRKLKRTDLSCILGDQSSKQQVDLISKMLIFDPNKRMSAKQALDHPFFNDLNDLKDSFKSYPVKVADYSNKKQDCTLQTYRQLIQGLCVLTKRRGSSKSKQSLISKISEKNTFVYQMHKKDNEEGFQQKSTRESHSGLLKKYEIKNKQLNQRVEQSIRSGKKQQKHFIRGGQSKNNIKARSKSKQSIKSINNKRKIPQNLNKSKSKNRIMIEKNYGTIKPVKSQININKLDSTKITKKKKKQ